MSTTIIDPACANRCDCCGRHPGVIDQGNGRPVCAVCRAAWLAHEAREHALIRRFAVVIAEARAAGFEETLIDCVIENAMALPAEDADATADLMALVSALLDEAEQLNFAAYNAKDAGHIEEAVRLFADVDRLRLDGARAAGVDVEQER